MVVAMIKPAGFNLEKYYTLPIRLLTMVYATPMIIVMPDANTGTSGYREK